MDKQLINKYLDKILQSRNFKKSKISSDLLEYLVHASFENKNPKEYTIGIELFGRKYENEIKQDSNIRVYIHNMRKKLKEYYEDEGSKDDVIFEIEKGKYQVNFKTRKEFIAKKTRNYRYHFLVTLGLLMVFVFLFLLKEVTKDGNSPWHGLPVWHGFAENQRKTLLVLGDYYVFNAELPTGNTGIFRDFSINSETEYQELLNKRPELANTLSRSNLTYLSKMSVFCESDIYKVFAAMGADIDVKLLSDIQPSDLKQHNVIFIGNYKNMGLFANIIREMSFSFGVSNASIQYIFSNDPCATVYESSRHIMKEEDFALVINAAGYSGNRFLFFLSSKDIGNISTVNQFTDPAYLSQFTTEHLRSGNSPDFKALYKVEGINKTDLSFELIVVE